MLANLGMNQYMLRVSTCTGIYIAATNITEAMCVIAYLWRCVAWHSERWIYKWHFWLKRHWDYTISHFIYCINYIKYIGHHHSSNTSHKIMVYQCKSSFIAKRGQKLMAKKFGEASLVLLPHLTQCSQFSGQEEEWHSGKEVNGPFFAPL